MELPSKVLRTNYYSVLFIFAGHNLVMIYISDLYLLYNFNYSKFLAYLAMLLAIAQGKAITRLNE